MVKLLTNIKWVFFLGILFLMPSCYRGGGEYKIMKQLESIAALSDTNFEPIYNIPLSRELIDNSQARAELFKITRKYDDYKIAMKRASEQDEKGIEIDKEQYQDLIRIIVKYHKSKSALTAKLRIGWLLIDSQTTRSYGISILKDIKENYSATWQAIYASLVIGTAYYLDAIGNDEKIREVAQYHIKDIDYYKKLDSENDPEFNQIQARGWVWWTKPAPVSARVLNAVAQWYDTLNEPEKSIEIAQNIIQEYPETHEADQAKLFLYDYIRSAEWKKYRAEYYQKNGHYPNFHETQQWRRDYDKTRSRKEMQELTPTEIELIKQPKTQDKKSE